MDVKKKEIFPPWQGMQYTRDMAEGKGALLALDVVRYGRLPWLRARDVLAPKYGSRIVVADQVLL